MPLNKDAMSLKRCYKRESQAPFAYEYDARLAFFIRIEQVTLQFFSFSMVK